MATTQLLTIIFLIAAAGSACAGEVIMQMRDRVIVSDPLVRISDIVDNFVGAKRDIDKIRDIVVMNLGGTTQYRRISNGRVDEVIRASGLAVTTSFQGALHSYVKISTQKVDLSNVLNEIKNKITGIVASTSAEHSVEVISGITELTVPQGEVRFSYKMPEDVLAKRIPVWLDVTVNDVHFSSIPVWYGVSVYTEVAVAANSIDSGQRLTTGDVRIEMLDIARYKTVAPVNSDWTNMRATTNLKAGQVINARHVNSLPPVYSGQTVRIISRYGNAEVQVYGVSLDDGEVDKKVRIKRNTASRIFNAVVEGQGVVSAIGGDYE